MWREGSPCTLLEIQIGAATIAAMENTMEIIQEIKNRTALDLAIPFLGIYPKEIKTRYRRDICAHMFIAALFTIEKVWKQPKFPSANEWIKKVW